MLTHILGCIPVHPCPGRIDPANPLFAKNNDEYPSGANKCPEKINSLQHVQYIRQEPEIVYKFISEMIPWAAAATVGLFSPVFLVTVDETGQNFKRPKDSHANEYLEVL